jgi:hypothetical protein
MAEISIPKQLSGPEALDSMLAELRKKLYMNGRFQSHMAYAGYRAEITVKFYPAASFIPPVEQEIEVEAQNGFRGFDGVVISETATVDEQLEIPVRPPNQVREDADMPTPVLTHDDKGGTVEKWVKRGKTPKNKVNGGNVGKEPLQTMVPTAIVAQEGEPAVTK